MQPTDPVTTELPIRIDVVRPIIDIAPPPQPEPWQRPIAPQPPTGGGETVKPGPTAEPLPEPIVVGPTVGARFDPRFKAEFQPPYPPRHSV